ncbi:NADH dehydrogenase [invertebrate metagenome]|uniref:NADH dehydrogenase n=1 Tax=invertebrate metagenome TaxID=1711999 RepID=A0A484H636_9ZZZZ
MSAPPIDKLSLVVFSGDFSRIDYALRLASAAAAVNIPATLFFTMKACQVLRQPGMNGPPNWADMQGGGMTCGVADGIATFEEVLTAAVALGVRFIVCETGLRAVGLIPADLRSDIPIEVAGMVTFLADSSRDGSIVFI